MLESPSPHPPEPALLCIHFFFAGIFLLSAAVQLNDPDPWRWVAIYLAAAAIGLGGWRRPEAAAGVGLVAVAWSLSIAAAGLEPLELKALLGDAVMKTAGVERWREMLGLAIIAAYALTTAAMQRAAAAAAPSSDHEPRPR